MIADFLQRNPFLRLLIPLAAGIVCADAVFFSQSFHAERMYGAWAYCAALAALLFLMIAVHWLSFFRNIRGCFGFVVFLFCFTLGFGVADAFLNLTFLPPDKEKKVYQVLIDEYPEAKNRSVLCHARLEGTVTEEGMQADGASRSLLLYFPPTSADSLRRGDRLWIYASLQLPPKYGNPDEFDYARYLLRTGSSATAYVSAGQWMPRGHDASRSLWQMAEDCREEVMAMYARLGIRGDNLAVLSALTVGEKRELSDGIRETYSVAGAAHVLALSGLHEELAEDIFQETFTKAIITIRQGRYNENGKFPAWLTRIAHNLMIDHFRQEKQESFVSCDEEERNILNSLSFSEGTVETEIVSRQILADVCRLMHHLPEEQKEVLHMRFYQDLSFKEIAELTGVSINTSLGRMRYAILNLRRMAEKHGVTLTVD